MVTQIYDIRLENWVAPSTPPRNLAAQKHEISVWLWTTSRLEKCEREYLRNATKYSVRS